MSKYRNEAINYSLEEWLRLSKELAGCTDPQKAEELRKWLEMFARSYESFMKLPEGEKLPDQYSYWINQGGTIKKVSILQERIFMLRFGEEGINISLTTYGSPVEHFLQDIPTWIHQLLSLDNFLQVGRFYFRLSHIEEIKRISATQFGILHKGSVNYVTVELDVEDDVNEFENFFKDFKILG